MERAHERSENDQQKEKKERITEINDSRAHHRERTQHYMRQRIRKQQKAACARDTAYLTGTRYFYVIKVKSLIREAH